jgi:lipopolysaccharide transport system ATP-binding protein
MSSAIRIDKLGKCYRLGQTQSHTLRDLINGVASRITRRGGHPTRRQAGQPVDGNSFWALRDVSFEIPHGEVMGIIGRNGAGKSTLLKILSQIVTPTTGSVEMRGRVASLLEVGTGFHPELTGRENVYLNGTILGMTRAEVRKNFDEIVAFSGVEQFIDTPVKRYSSGMAVRLGFAVAAHLEAEILIVDEVLAVGDVEFQRKCINKMHAVSDSGKTVLFVSHNMASIRALTRRAVVLSRGSLVFSGSTADAVDRYLQENHPTNQDSVAVLDRPRPFDDLSRDLEFESLDVDAGPGNSIDEGTNLVISVGIRCRKSAASFQFGLTIFRNDESPVGSTFSKTHSPLSAGEASTYKLRLPTSELAPGQYYCAISISDARTGGRRLIDSVTDVLPFTVHAPAMSGQEWQAAWGPIRFPDVEIVESQFQESVADTSTIGLHS